MRRMFAAGILNAIGAPLMAALAGCSGGNAALDASIGSDAMGPNAATIVDLPNGAAGIGLDDLRYSAGLGRIVVPAGRTGNVDLVDPATLVVTSFGGFTSAAQFDGSDQQGVESADEGGGLVFGNDRSAFKLGVVDPLAQMMVASVQLERTEPDYVRYVQSTHEVWITNPGMSRIEVLSVPATGTPIPTHAAFIDVPGGVEGLTIDDTRHQAYTHLFAGAVAVVDIRTRAVVANWPTGCASSHGIPALDDRLGWLFAGCSSARTVVLDIDHGGAQLGSYTLGPGPTILAYSPSLRHLYIRGDGYPQVAVLQVSPLGALSLLGMVSATPKGHCMTADDRGNFWVCDWQMGRLLRFQDPYPGA